MTLVARKVGKKKKIIYYVRYRDDVRTGDGTTTKIVRRQRFVSLGTSDKKLAKKLFNDLLSQYEEKNARRRLGITESLKTLEDLIARFNNSYNTQQLRKSTLDDYRRSFTRLLLFAETETGSTALSNVTPELIEEFLAKRLIDAAGNSTGAGADKDMRQLKAIFNWGAKKKFCPGGLFDGIARLNLRRREPVILSDEQVKKLFEEADKLDAARGIESRRMGLFLRLGYFGGFRSEEIRALLTSELDLGQRLQRVVNVPEIGFKVKKNKERVVRLLPPIIEMIKKYGTMPNGSFLVGYQDPDSWVWRQDWKLVRKAAGLEAVDENGRSFEVRLMRHNFALRFIQLTQSDTLTRAMMGHSSDSETLINNYLVERKSLIYPASTLWEKKWGTELMNQVA